ncbi:MAG: flavodoxin [Clostridiales bacterium]|nr:flavodoxin [Clostridiales bacterium]
MSKNLVAYFSASGVTAKVAKKLARVLNAELYEIRPQTAYTDEDLDWRNKQSRSSVEMHDLAFRPPLADHGAHISSAETVFIGFPIWWYIAPTIINTFLEDYDFTGKKVVLFATSGGSGFGKTVDTLKKSCPGAQLIEGRVFKRGVTEDELLEWANTFKD